MPLADGTLTLADGRSLDVRDSGTGEIPLVFHFGTPSGAVALPFLESASAQRGLRLISWSRPGYGRSTPRPDGAAGARIADDVADTEAVLDHLGLDEFVTVGWSGGGPRALGCAALLPLRCRAAASVAGLAPPLEIDWDVREGMAEENVEEFTAMLESAETLERYLETQRGLFSVTGEEVAESLGGLAPPADRAVLTGELADALAASFREAGRQGVVAWRDDDLALVRPWGFSMADIGVPVSVWAGTEDTMVPFRHGEWLAAHVPGARPRLLEGEGHISLMAGADRILDDLLEQSGS